MTPKRASAYAWRVERTAFDEGFEDGIQAVFKLARQNDQERGRVSQKYHVWPRDERKHLRLRFHIEQELNANPALRRGEDDLASEKL
jgi:hypothetical protein